MLAIAVALLAGAFALFITPREEEPQIVVPSADVLIEAPSLTARQMERLVARSTGWSTSTPYPTVAGRWYP